MKSLISIRFLRFIKFTLLSQRWMKMSLRKNELAYQWCREKWHERFLNSLILSFGCTLAERWRMANYANFVHFKHNQKVHGFQKIALASCQSHILSCTVL